MVLASLLPVLALAGLETPALFPERFYAPSSQVSRFDSLSEIQAVDMDGDGAPDIVGTFRAAPIVGTPPNGVFVQRGLGGNEFDPVDAGRPAMSNSGNRSCDVQQVAGHGRTLAVKDRGKYPGPAAFRVRVTSVTELRVAPASSRPRI